MKRKNHYYDEDELTPLQAIGVCAALVAVIVVATLVVKGCDRNDMPNATKRPGCPLDAIEYYSPAFTGNDSPCYLIEDRSSGQRWWRVRMSDGWVVMPILEVEQ